MKLICLVFFIGAEFVLSNSCLGVDEPLQAFTQVTSIASLPMKAQNIEEIINFWRKLSQATTNQKRLLIWNEQVTAEKRTRDSMINAIINLPVQGKLDSIQITTIVELGGKSLEGESYGFHKGEKHLLNAIIKRATKDLKLNEPNAVIITVSAFQGFMANVYSGFPCVTFSVMFNKRGQTYQSSFRLFLPKNERDGLPLPGLNIRAVREKTVDGVPIPDTSGIQDSYDGFFESAGSIRPSLSE